jgi:CRISPR/Cas system CSM-associated protein Csm3 (group 7 of RAMP superfamily)
MPRHFRMTLSATAHSALHITGPGRTLPLVDRPLQLDEQGLPVIPASSVRGRIRAHLERLLPAFGLPVCSPPRPELMCPHARVPDGFCLACRVFGSPRRDAAVLFNDLKVQPIRPLFNFPQRIQVSISRRLNTAQAERLFSSETTPFSENVQSVFAGQISGRAEPVELGWMIAAIALVEHIGGDKARGLGRVRLSATQLQWWDANSRQWQSDDTQNLVEAALNDADTRST